MKFALKEVVPENLYAKGGIRNILDGSKLASMPKFIENMSEQPTKWMHSAKFLTCCNKASYYDQYCYIRKLLGTKLTKYVALIHCWDEYLDGGSSKRYVDSLLLTKDIVLSVCFIDGGDETCIEVTDYDTMHSFLSTVEGKRFGVAFIKTTTGAMYSLEQDDKGNIVLDSENISSNIEPPLMGNTETSKQENENMSKVQTIVNANKNAAITAAKLEAGRIALAQVTKAVHSKAPMMVRGYLDTPLGRAVVANIFSLAVDQYASNNNLAKELSDAALQAAALEVVQSFNISELIDEVIQGVGKGKLDVFKEVTEEAKLA